MAQKEEVKNQGQQKGAGAQRSLSLLLLKYLLLSTWLTFLQRLLPLTSQEKCLSAGFVFNLPSYLHNKQERALELLLDLPDLANQNTGHAVKAAFQINNKY